MSCYYYSLAYKDESNTTSTPGRITASVIDLKSLPSTPSRRAETLHHHHHHHRPYRKVVEKSTLNKTDEHCRSLFNLLSTSLRPRHHQTSNNKGVDAVSMKNERKEKEQEYKKRDLLRHTVVSTYVVTLHSSIINPHIYIYI
jgi:hypothetical protein